MLEPRPRRLLRILSGWNRLITLITTCAILAFAFISPAHAQVVYGVNNPKLLGSTETVWKASLDTMSANGVHLVRMTMAQNTKAETIIALLRYAEQLSIKVILIYPAELREYFASPTPLHQYTGGSIWAGWGLSPVDVSRFETYWRAHRAAMRQAGVHIYAYELGNEENGVNFNRDYPTGDDARLLDLQSCDKEPGCATVRTGWDKYIGMLRVMRSSNLLDGTLLLGGSFVNVGPGYIQAIHGSFSTPSSTRAYLAKHGADDFVDAYTYHVYPVVSPKVDLNAGKKVLEDQLSSPFNQCRSGGNKPCWITEWGFPDEGIKCQDSPRQDAFVRDADALFHKHAAQQGLFVAVYYSWDTGDKYAVYDCGHVASPVIANLLRSGPAAASPTGQAPKRTP